MIDLNKFVALLALMPPANPITNLQNLQFFIHCIQDIKIEVPNQVTINNTKAEYQAYINNIDRYISQDDYINAYNELKLLVYRYFEPFIKFISTHDSELKDLFDPNISNVLQQEDFDRNFLYFSVYIERMQYCKNLSIYNLLVNYPLIISGEYKNLFSEGLSTRLAEEELCFKAILQAINPSNLHKIKELQKSLT